MSKVFEDMKDINLLALQCYNRSVCNCFSVNVLDCFCASCNQEACEGGLHSSVQHCETVEMLKDTLESVADIFCDNLIGG